MKGHLSPWLFVQCGMFGCDVQLSVAHRGARPQALMELRKLQWVETKLHGWVCPECAAKDRRYA